MTPIEQVPAGDWKAWIEHNDGVLLDVRDPEETVGGTLPGALVIPMTEIIDRVDEIPKGRAILCVCRSGGRSQQVASFLACNERVRVANLSGGMHQLGLQD